MKNMQLWEAYMILNTPQGYAKETVEQARRLVNICQDVNVVRNERDKDA